MKYQNCLIIVNIGVSVWSTLYQTLGQKRRLQFCYYKFSTPW